MSTSSPVIGPNANSSVAVTATHRPAFFNPSTLPWTDWVMEGTWFKLLNVNPISGGFTLLLKVSASNTAPIHGHFGAVEAYIVEGGFSYDDDHGRVGDYVYEGAGIRHIPNTHEDGVIMFAVVHGPLGGFHEDGSIAAVVDARLMYDMAVANNAADHVEKPSHW